MLYCPFTAIEIAPISVKGYCGYFKQHLIWSLAQAVESSLKRVNLFDNKVGDKQCRKYSGGMKRRLSVAISLIGNPHVKLFSVQNSLLPFLYSLWFRVSEFTALAFSKVLMSQLELLWVKDKLSSFLLRTFSIAIAGLIFLVTGLEAIGVEVYAGLTIRKTRIINGTISGGEFLDIQQVWAVVVYNISEPQSVYPSGISRRPFTMNVNCGAQLAGGVYGWAKHGPWPRFSVQPLERGEGLQARPCHHPHQYATSSEVTIENWVLSEERRTNKAPWVLWHVLD